MNIPGWVKHIKNPKVSRNNYIPVYSPILIGNEKKYVNQCLDEGWLSSKGSFVSLFEKKFSDYCHSRYAVACSSGTAALQLALATCNLQPKDEVIIPTFTMISTAFAVSYLGAKINFADCEIDTGNIDISDLEKKYNKYTKVIMPVDIYGCPCDYIKINKFAKSNKVTVVEDAAEAFGSEFSKKRVGSISDLTAFSLYVNKTITTGQGGIVTTSSKSVYNKLNKLNNYYFSSERHFWHKMIGYNFRISNLQAAVGLAQLEYVDKILERKRKIAQLYLELLKPVGEYISPLIVPKECRTNYWQIAYRLRFEKYDTMKLRTILGQDGIETRSFFIPLHLQPPYYKPSNVGKFPNSELLAKTGFLLPSGPTVSPDQVQRISEIIVNYFKK